MQENLLPSQNISLCSGPILPHKATRRKHVCCTWRLDNNLELTFGLQEHAMSLGPNRSDTHRVALTGDTGDPILDTSRQKIRETIDNIFLN
ncbi:hypothetical protein CK203_101989 [Vitis vinifera]|uniref:Uncharacterized protein n=1 Tax=Vitis vinifera TaxID=29760 RepID=A0A438D8Q5_VITVI|nr:hypothetical protein CK203_101989 [Vitis vinifera]